jgi:hypothetical protein
VLSHLPGVSQATLTGQSFFPGLISGPFHGGLIVVFSVSTALSVLAGLASLLRGSRKTATAGGTGTPVLARPDAGGPGMNGAAARGPELSRAEPADDEPRKAGEARQAG